MSMSMNWTLLSRNCSASATAFWVEPSTEDAVRENEAPTDPSVSLIFDLLTLSCYSELSSKITFATGWSVILS